MKIMSNSHKFLKRQDDFWHGTNFISLHVDRLYILEQLSHPKFFSVSIGVGFDPTEFRPQMGP